MKASSTMRIVPRPRATSAGAPADRRHVAPAHVAILALLAVLGLPLGLAACDGVGVGASVSPPTSVASPELRTGRVVSVADGDTIRVRLGGVVERVRIIGLDTPEVDAELRTPACYGAEATAFAEATLGGRTVGIEADPTQDERDRFGRLLAHVWVDGQLYAAAAIEGGIGIHYIYDRPSIHAGELQAAQDAARAAGAGLWSACEGRVDLPLASP